MKFEIPEHKKNQLMERAEYVISLDHEGKATPSRPEIAKELAKKLDVSEDVIIIDKILSKSGYPASELRVLVYDKKGSIPKYKLEAAAKRVKKGEAPAETQPAAPEAKE